MRSFTKSVFKTRNQQNNFNHMNPNDNFKKIIDKHNERVRIKIYKINCKECIYKIIIIT